MLDEQERERERERELRRRRVKRPLGRAQQDLATIRLFISSFLLMIIVALKRVAEEKIVKKVAKLPNSLLFGSGSFVFGRLEIVTKKCRNYNDFK
jgi:hypothetical protein